MPFGFPERLFPKGKYDVHRMRIFALVISWISILYNGIEGGVSIGFGIDVKARALIVFGIQSFIEVLSAALVIYRFRQALHNNTNINLSLERRATLGIGILFIVLTIGTWIASAISLATHAEPDSSNPSLIISAASLFCMILIWLPKPWIAAELNSSVMHGEAACSLACIYLTIVLLVGSIIYKLWSNGWWIDSTVAIILGLFFLYQGYEMITWARDKNFNGGCCKTCTSNAAPMSFSDGTVMGNSDNESIKKSHCSDEACDNDDTSDRKPLLADKSSNSCNCCNSTGKNSSSDTNLIP